MAIDYGSCPLCGRQVELTPKAVLHTPEAPIDFMGNRVLLAVRSEVVGVTLDCGHVMTGGTWTPDDGMTWTP
jgi:hypothetical protein